MGIIACLAYMFIDLERNEVERGHKAVHNPLKGQVLAMNLARYGKQVRVPLLISATVALIGGFALLNQGLYETVGRGWYRIADERTGADLRRFPGVRPHESPGHRGRPGSGQVAPSHRGRVRPSRPHGRPRRCWPGSSCSSRWCCSIRSSPRCGRGNCWRRRSPISGARTSRSTSGRGMPFPSTARWRSARCWGRCAWSRR